MAWQNELVIILRHIVDDLDSSSYMFSDSRLEESILVASQLIHNEMEFTVEYTIEVDNGVLSPDPTLTSPKDDDFIALCCMRAAVMLMTSMIKTYSLKSISIRDGASALDTRGIVQGLSQVYKDITTKYEDMKLAYQTGKLGFGKSILGPYSPGSDTANRGYVDYRSGFFN
jgi:hypothetical protein